MAGTTGDVSRFVCWRKYTPPLHTQAAVVRQVSGDPWRGKVLAPGAVGVAAVALQHQADLDSGASVSSGNDQRETSVRAHV